MIYRFLLLVLYFHHPVVIVHVVRLHVVNTTDQPPCYQPKHYSNSQSYPDLYPLKIRILLYLPLIDTICSYMVKGKDVL